jgi:hypothetical protein
MNNLDENLVPVSNDGAIVSALREQSTLTSLAADAERACLHSAELRVHLYDLRHTAATLSLAARAPEK